MVDEARARRLAERIHQIVAGTLENGVKDYRLGMVTVTGVRVTPDLREATVFYTVLGDVVECRRSRAALQSARGLLRAEVGRRTGIKFTPTLEFVHDQLPATARRIDRLVARARAADAAMAAAAAAAEPAGDAHPYRLDDPADPADPDDPDDPADPADPADLADLGEPDRTAGSP